MTNATKPLPSPEPEEVRALLDSAQEANGYWTCYRIAQAVGVNESTLSRAKTGAVRLRGSTWLLMRLMLRRSERDALPAAPLD